MSVGLLIISHDGIGPAILGTAKFMLNTFPMDVRLLSASRDCMPDELLVDAGEQIDLLDQGDGVLIITDLYGATPSNIAQKLSAEKNIKIISGLNLSMLLKVFNYHKLGLDELAHKAIEGGVEGILNVGERS